MGKEMCLVINNTDRDIRIAEFWEKYLSNFNSIEKSPFSKGEIIVRNECTDIKPSQFIERCQKWQLSNNADLYKWVSLSDDSENGVVLSKEDIDANTGFVITCTGKNNRLVKEAVSKEESKSSGKRKESKEELKDRLISIVKKRNDASGHGEQKNAFAAVPEKLRGKPVIFQNNRNWSS